VVIHLRLKFPRIVNILRISVLSFELMKQYMMALVAELNPDQRQWRQWMKSVINVHYDCLHVGYQKEAFNHERNSSWTSVWLCVSVLRVSFISRI